MGSIESIYFHQKLNGTESQQTHNKYVAIELLDTQVFFWVRSVGPTVGDFLDQYVISYPKDLIGVS